MPSAIWSQSRSLSCGGISRCTERASSSRVLGQSLSLYSGAGPHSGQLNGQPFLVGIIFSMSIFQWWYMCQSGTPWL